MSVQMNSVSENEISSNSVRYKFLEDGGNPNMQIRDGVTLLCMVTSIVCRNLFSSLQSFILKLFSLQIIYSI